MLSRQWYSQWSVGGSYHVNSPGWSSFMKLQILLTPCLHEVGRLFLFKAFQPLFLTYLHTVVVATLILRSWSFLCVLNYYAMPCTYNFLKTISHLFKDGHSLLVCLPKSLLFTTHSLIVQTSSTVKQFFWLNGQKTVKIGAWALAQTLKVFIFMKEKRK